MKIGILSDSHEHFDNAEIAVTKIQESGCEVLLFCGDFCGPGCAIKMAKFKGEKHFIFGNNDGDHFSIYQRGHQIDDSIHWHRESNGSIEIDSTKIFITHYPTYARHAAKSGEYDLVCFGHNHVYSIDIYNQCLAINSGTLNSKIRSAKAASYAIYDTASKTATIYDLENNILEEKSL